MVTSSALTSYVAQLPANGVFSIWVGPLDGPATFAVHDDLQHYAASMMKLPVTVAGYRRADAGTLDLDSPVEVRNDFTSADGVSRFSLSPADDSDRETWQRMGTPVALRWLAHRSIVVSGNLATNLVLDAVGLPAVAEALTVLGTTGTVVARGIEDAPARDIGLQNMVTAADMASSLREVAAHRAATADSCERILDTLAAQQINDSISRGLPPGTKLAHKTGWVEGVAHDAGIVYPDDCPPYIVSVCTTSTLSDEEAREIIAGVAAASWADRKEAG